ncbi:hypothetical protein SJX93_06020 [Streptomyces cyaneofuscatus]|uniref:hypothetical protein n=1 Tax=Streptomyces cyaneofuscatus TaxID=66883 RepID=UPI002D79221B|nr:hypothetical protein [Streptomyces cyaneofuscatus]WRO09196.1 hypothetical protein SJX93_06020 [Streptomyces cyaneofuscatus]
MTAVSPRLEKVTADTVLDACRLEVAPAQRKFVSPVAQSLAEAYVHPDVAWPRLICDGDRIVGFEFYLKLGYRKRGLTDDGEYLGDMDLKG